MTIEKSTPEPVVLVAIDVAKDCHEALIEAPSWPSRKRLRVRNTAEEFRAPLSRGGGAKWKNPFCAGRRGVSDLVDNVRVFHLEGTSF